MDDYLLPHAYARSSCGVDGCEWLGPVLNVPMTAENMKNNEKEIAAHLYRTHTPFQMERLKKGLTRMVLDYREARYNHE